MNGLRPPLTAPPGFAVRQSRSDSKECCRPALLFREGEFPWQTRKPIKNISSAGTTPLARLLSAVPDSVRPCRNYVELHIILLYFPAFCDTILILINFTAENSRWNINIFAKVFPAKSPQIHPTISEFAEWEWWLSAEMCLKSQYLCGFAGIAWITDSFLQHFCNTSRTKKFCNRWNSYKWLCGKTEQWVMKGLWWKNVRVLFSSVV